MNLLSLPPDILLSIADFTPETSLNSLVQTTSSLYNLLDAALYRSNIRRSHSSALLWACLHGHATVARKLLALHADPNTTTASSSVVRRRCRRLISQGPGSQPRTWPSLLHALESDIRRGQVSGLGMPLVYAAAGGHVEIMAMLIAHGADVHRTAPYPGSVSRHKTAAGGGTRGKKRSVSASSACCHYTPLMMAADGGHTAAIELLLAHGVDVDVPRARCHSPLSLAAVNGHIPAMRTLLAHGADVNLVRRGGSSTALVMAIQARRVDAVKELLQAGADPVLSSAVLCAISMDDDDPEMLFVLLHHAPTELERQDAIGRTPLAYAAWEEKSRAVDTLLAHGADANANAHARTNRLHGHGHGQTPLWWAVLANCVPATRSLLSAGADPECLAVVNGSLTSVLVVAMERFYYDVVDVLLELGADPNTSDGRALALAVQQGEYALVEKMLVHGADPNIRDPVTASTALYCALANRDVRMVRCLLEHGASPHSLVKAKGRRRGRVSPVVCAMKTRLWDAVALLITHGADPTQSWDGTPVLVKAVGTGNEHLVRLLIAHGACVDVVDRHGRTPRSLARLKGTSIDGCI